MKRTHRTRVIAAATAAALGSALVLAQPAAALNITWTAPNATGANITWVAPTSGGNITWGSR
jgi:hypothetical protein